MKTLLCLSRLVVCCLFGLLVLLSQLSGTVQAQSTADVCRQTRQVLDQILREGREVLILVYVKGNEEKVRDDYASLNSDINKGIYRTADRLQEDIRGFDVDAPRYSNGSVKEPVAWTPPERAAMQIAIRNAMAKELDQAAKTNLADLKYRFQRLKQQQETREQRWQDLRCDEVLNGEGSSNDNNSLAGTWEGTAGDGRFREIWTISGGGESWTVSGTYLDMKTNEQKGAFTAQNVKFKDGKLSFHQVFSPKPDDGWADSNDISEVTANGDTLNFTHKWGSVTLKRKK